MFSQQNSQNATNFDNREGNKTDLLSLATSAHQQYLIKANNEDLIKAINYYIQAIKTDPNISSAYYRLASLMLESGQIGIDGALEQCRRAVEIDPENPNARMYLGYFLSQNGEYDAAKEQFKIGRAHV